MFTGQERDGELVPNADYFNARYFMGVLGNFTRPDPANAGADLYNPQSWNAYAYVLGNPLGNVDPSGMWWCDPDDPSCDPDWPPPFFPPCFFFDCDGGGGGGGNGGGSGGGRTSSNTPRSTPLPPNSFPGGETLGLPPGMRVPLPSPAVMLGLNLNLNCEFGVCVGGAGGSGFSGDGGLGEAIAVECLSNPLCAATAGALGLGGYMIWKITPAKPIQVPSDFHYAGPQILIQPPTILFRGKGNVADTGITEEANQLIQAGKAPDICNALDQLMSAAKAAGDTARVLRIKRTQKAMGCRASRQSR
jgi:RHS repeat-associated protein